MATAKTRKRSPMSSEHKAALARGREEGRVVRKYLDGLEQNRPKRGRRRTPESIKRKLLTINNRLLEADSLTRLHLLQERANLEAESARIGAADEMTGLERAFIKVARSYGDRKGIGYKAWRAAGVSAPVLQKAGISRTTRGSVA
ncbi:MAG TPA: hypothetical protein VEJ87_11995 [Acidimicrobiales bacterium]|nr:hypothetical protein [Acidimicrobiales bacterium]